MLIFILFNIFQIVLAWLFNRLVILSGDVEVNPGPKKKDKDCLSVCQNLNSISTCGYSKLFILNSYNLLHKFNIICLSETYPDSNTPLDDLIILLMMTIWKSLVTRWCILIIHLIQNAQVSISTTKTI